MTVTMKDAVLWDVTPYGSCNSRHSSEVSVATRATRRSIREDSECAPCKMVTNWAPSVCKAKALLSASAFITVRIHSCSG
jgi:hypothetical protein